MNTLLRQGAYNAITKCIKLLPEERIVIITDESAFEVGEALRDEASKVTPNVLFLKIEDFCERPAKSLPEKLKSEIATFRPVVSIYSAHGKVGELPVFRAPLIDFLTKELGCRHAHMISITKEIMEIGMNQDMDQVYKVTHNLKRRLDRTKQVRVKDMYGSDLVFDLDNSLRKNIPDDMLIKKGKMANLPGGEVFTCPINVNGTLVAWLFGDFFSEKYGELSEPLVVEIADSYITSTSVRGKASQKVYDLKNEFETYTSQYEFGNRVGELGIGTLVGLTGFIGNMLQDEKYPGVHVAFGHTFPDDSGADWDCPSHIDLILKKTTSELQYESDECEVVMYDGVFMPDLLA